MRSSEGTYAEKKVRENFQSLEKYSEKQNPLSIYKSH
jgi:hypothetical protein